MSEPLMNVVATVTTQISAQVISLNFEAPNDRNKTFETRDAYIEPGARFVLRGDLPGPPNPHGWVGYGAAEFLAKFGGFVFAFEADDIRCQHKFSFAEAKTMAEALEETNRPQPPPATVRMKQ
jgi:hypothetical protein